jgi:hypothetical protein
LRKTGEWNTCNANHASYCVGFPRDCGETGKVGGRWFRRYKSSMDNNCGSSARGNFGHATFQILKKEWCPVSCTDESPDRVSISSSNSLVVDFSFDYLHKFDPHQVGAKIGPYVVFEHGAHSFTHSQHSQHSFTQQVKKKKKILKETHTSCSNTTSTRISESLEY